MAYHNMSRDIIKKRRMEAEMDKFEEEISKPIVNHGSAGYSSNIPTASLYQFIPHQIQRQVPSSNRSSLPAMSSAPSNNTTASVAAAVPSPAISAAKSTMNRGFQAINASGSTVNSSLSSLSSPTNPGYTVTPMGLPPGVTLSSLAPPVSTVPGTSNKKSNKNSEKPTSKAKKILRMAGGQIWEDNSLLEWDPDDFRLFVGDLGNDVTDEVLTRGFSKYPSFVKAKVIRDKRTNKSKGYGFVSFKDPNDYIRAMREMDGKYLGSRPIKLRKSTWKERSLDVVKKKQKEKAKLAPL